MSRKLVHLLRTQRRQPEGELLRQQKRRSGWEKFIAGFKYALQGLGYTIRTQRNMRFHLGATCVVCIAGMLLRISAVEFAMVFVAIMGVVIAEMFNTVIELCVDLASPDYHPLAGLAKDVAAGAVLLSAILSVIIGMFIFGPPLLAVIIK